MSERPTFSRKEHHLSIRMLQCINLCYARIYHQVTIRTPCRLPRHGPAILVCNHLSGLDPVLIQSACPRLIRWMMAKEYYTIKALRPIFDMVGAIPVDRGTRDTSSTRAAFKALDAGYVLGVFPEGKIETRQELLPFQNGVVLMAGKTGVPVCPAYLEGTQRGKTMQMAYATRNRCTLSFGEPFIIGRAQAEREQLAQTTALVQQRVEQLRQAELLCRRERRSFIRPLT